MENRAWKGKTGGGAIGQKALVVFFRCFDVRIGYALLFAIVPFYMLFARQRCRSIYRYFRLRRNCGVWASWKNTYLNHLLFGRTLLDKFAIFSGKGRRYQVSVSGKACFDAALEAGKGVILAGAHVGNPELAGYLLPSGDTPVSGIVFAQEAATMQALRQQTLGKRGIDLIPVLPDMSHIFRIHEALRQKNIVTLPCDRIFTGNKNRVFPFLNGKAAFPLGAFYLAEYSGAAVLSFFVMKEAAFRYHIHIRPLTAEDETPRTAGRNSRRDERAAALGRSFVQTLEELLDQYPRQWFNFYEFWQEENAYGN